MQSDILKPGLAATAMLKSEGNKTSCETLILLSIGGLPEQQKFAFNECGQKR